MDNSAKQKIENALEDFKDNVKFEVETSKADSETKELCLQISRQVFYLIDEVKKHI